MKILMNKAMDEILINEENINDPEIQALLWQLMSQISFQPRPALNLPSGIEQFKQFAPQGKYQELVQTIPFQNMVWGKTNRVLPRLVCSFSPEELPQFPVLQEMVETALRSHPLFENSSYKSIWINHYRDGLDHTPYHQDSYDSSVMMISVGESRALLTKQIPQNGEKVPRAQNWNCQDGDIIVFTPEWNDRHKHSVPKRTRVGQGRISIVVFLN